MTDSELQEWREFMRLKHHSHGLKNQQLGQFSLFRDQGVGGSNPLSPTNSNQALTDLTRNRGFTKGFTFPQALAVWA
jgi:hypothetical protein